MTALDLGTVPAGARPRRATPGRRYLDGHPLFPFKLVLVVMLAAMLAAFGLLPQQIGGQMSFVITDGTSMLPHIRTGDLVIVRREPIYRVGEVAAFHDQQLHVIVLHRIVAIRGDHYVFKGDNNNFVTSYEPTKPQIVGAEWFQIPRAGRLILGLRSPPVAAAALAALWLFSFSGRSSSRRRRRRHRHV